MDQWDRELAKAGIQMAGAAAKGTLGAIAAGHPNSRIDELSGKRQVVGEIYGSGGLFGERTPGRKTDAVHA